jgi:hypothetical protein
MPTVRVALRASDHENLATLATLRGQSVTAIARFLLEQAVRLEIARERGQVWDVEGSLADMIIWPAPPMPGPGPGP